MPTFSAARGDASFTDAHGVEIVYSTWRAARPKGVVQIAHGVGEHGLRYEPLAQDLVRAGYTVHANDHRGHGRTGLTQWDGDHAKLGRLGPGGLRAAIAAVEQMSAVARADEPGLPLVLLGHSWGSLMAQRIVNTSSDRYDGVVLSASAYRLPGWMNSGDLNSRHAGSGPTKYEWLTRDRKIIDAMALDPPGGRGRRHRALRARRHPPAARCAAAGGSRTTSRCCCRSAPTTPSGGPRSIERLAQAYRRRGRLSDVTVQVYEGARHEVYNETNRAEVIGDLVAWLDRVTAR
ncbi:alpha/beta hydrolase [Curtobacterium flaccumfaciens pv. flaccumfaciens]